MIYLFTPALLDNYGTPSTNLGDFMIQEAVVRELYSIFPKKEIKLISSHTALPKNEVIIGKDDLCFVGGSNLLSSEMNHYAQWKISFRDILQIRNAILLGVGWWQYQGTPNLYTKLLLKRVLSSKFIHSVRDGHTSKMLEFAGIKNCYNTGCPTMWPLLAKDLGQIPNKKSNHALVMLTDYNKAPLMDKALFRLIADFYDKIYFWPQGSRDLEYLSELRLDIPVKILERSIAKLDQFIKSGIGFDYIGTRLHGGIRCLINNKRSLILEIDNRAREINRDTGLPSAERTDLEFIRSWINIQSYTNITLNKNAILEWSDQF